jgi:hypothetical protein
MIYISLLTISTLVTQGNLGTLGTQLLNYPRNYDKFATKQINQI